MRPLALVWQNPDGTLRITGLREQGKRPGESFAVYAVRRMAELRDADASLAALPCAVISARAVPATREHRDRWRLHPDGDRVIEAP